MFTNIMITHFINPDIYQKYFDNEPFAIPKNTRNMRVFIIDLGNKTIYMINKASGQEKKAQMLIQNNFYINCQDI